LVLKKPLVSLSGRTRGSWLLAPTPIVLGPVGAFPGATDDGGGITPDPLAFRGGMTGIPPIPAIPGIARIGIGGGGAFANPGILLPGTFTPGTFWGTT